MDLTARLQRLPVFPLPSAHLFPHAVLPLHIFEPRYRQLVADALAGDRVFAMVEPTGVEKPDAAPPLARMCGVGELIAHEPLPDGRSHILLHGLGRARILEELPQSRPYREVRAELVADQYPAGLDLGSATRAVTALADALAARLPEGGDTLRGLARAHADPGALADVLAAALVVDPDERRKLFGDPNVATRLETISAQLVAAIARFGDGRGKSN